MKEKLKVRATERPVKRVKGRLARKARARVMENRTAKRKQAKAREKVKVRARDSNRRAARKRVVRALVEIKRTAAGSGAARIRTAEISSAATAAD